MTISLYDVSVGCYLQSLGGVANVLSRGEAMADEGNLDLSEIVRYKLREDMLPFSFQVISVWHHSLGAINGIKAGVFEPPPRMSGMTYDKLKDLVSEAQQGLEALAREEIDSLADKSMVFKIGDRETPFTATNFVLSFSLPNFYFHATTTYDVLRIHGVPLGKMDYLGHLKIGV